MALPDYIQISDGIAWGALTLGTAFNSLADGDAAHPDRITGLGEVELVRCLFDLALGANPTTGNLIEAYWLDDDGTIRVSGEKVTGTTAASYTAPNDVELIRSMGRPIRAIPVYDTTSAQDYRFACAVEPWTENGYIVIVNNTGEALASSGHSGRYSGRERKIVDST